MLRPVASAAVLGGLCWIAFALTGVLSAEAQDARVVLEGTADYAAFGLFAVSLALAVAAVAAIHLHQRGADGRLGRRGAAVAAAGAAAQCVVISAIVVSGEEPAWFSVAAPLAILTWVAGSIMLGIATRRAGLMPGWVGIALPLVTLVAIVGSEVGTSALIGAFQIVVGARIARAANAGAAAHPTARNATARA